MLYFVFLYSVLLCYFGVINDDYTNAKRQKLGVARGVLGVSGTGVRCISQ